MADTAAFFASKKKKGSKKKFKSFNANKIDASSVLTSTHVDAPEMSEGVSGLSLGGTKAGDNDDWDESQAAAWGSNAATNNSGSDSKVSELLDMQALQVKRNEEDDVAERLRVEETKAQLARAKEGMAKEAERLAAEKAEKEAKAAQRKAAASEATGGRWVPAHMRNSGGAVSVGGGGLSSTNEELFPDLAAADKILADKEKQEEEERKRIANSQPIRAPSGWGSRLGGGSAAAAAPAQRKPLNLASASAERKPLNLAPPPAAAAAEKSEVVDTKEPVAEKTEDKPATETPAPAPAAAKPAPAATATPTPAPEKKKVLKKKKKKDLSSFKA